MHEAVISPIEVEALCYRESRQVFQMKSIEEFQLIGSRGCGKRPETAPVACGNMLRHRMIVVTSYGACCVRPHPLDAGKRIRPVVDHIPEKQAGIERFLDRRKSGPICMNVGKNKDFHRS